MNSDMERYSRQLLFQPIGESGQQKLFSSRVAIVGVGALGTVMANHLVRSGVGYIRLIDRDFVEKSNLQRQMLFDERDAEQHIPKSVAAANKLKLINSSVQVDPVIADVHAENAEELLADVDLILDGSDNFSVRYLINDVSLKHSIPWIYGGAVSSRGVFAVLYPGKTPCYRCLFPDPPTGLGETCDTVGVLSPMTDIIGSYQSVEAIKVLIGANFNPNMEQMDIWHHSSFQMDISDGHNPDCPACVHHHFEFLDRSGGHVETYTTLCGRDTVQVTPPKRHETDLEKRSEILSKLGHVELNRFLLRFTTADDYTLVFFKDGRVLVQGTDDSQKAKTLYSKYAGN